MLSDITLGQYYPARSIIHKLDGRVKILLVLALIPKHNGWDAPLTICL